MYTRAVHEHKYKIIDDRQSPGLVRGFECSGFAYADYVGQNSYSITLTSPNRTMNYVKSREDVALLWFSDRDWVGQRDMAYICKVPLVSQIDLYRDCAATATGIATSCAGSEAGF